MRRRQADRRRLALFQHAAVWNHETELTSHFSEKMYLFLVRCMERYIHFSFDKDCMWLWYIKHRVYEGKKKKTVPGVLRGSRSIYLSNYLSIYWLFLPAQSAFSDIPRRNSSRWIWWRGTGDSGFEPGTSLSRVRGLHHQATPAASRSISVNKGEVISYGIDSSTSYCHYYQKSDSRQVLLEYYWDTRITHLCRLQPFPW
jgi:hypothetical protein